MNHRIVIVGCGSMSNTWIDYAIQRNDVEIVCLVDVHTKTAKQMAIQKNLDVPVYSDLSEALIHHDANIVFDITIPAAHKQVATTALEAGCHVFGEKPMAESLKDAQDMIKIVNATNKTYSIMQNRRYNKQIRALHNLISTKKIGEIGSIHADFFIGPHFGGFRDVMESPLILDMAIHTFDQARFITGADPVSVYCHEFNSPGSWYKGNASAICIFEMSNGIAFSYRGSWSAEGLRTSWESEWRVTGSKGSARWDGEQQPFYELVDESQPQEFLRAVTKEVTEANWQGNEGHWGCLDEMFLALEQNRLAETNCHDNIKSMAMVFGAIESARTGKKVALEPMYKS